MSWPLLFFGRVNVTAMWERSFVSLPRYVYVRLDCEGASEVWIGLGGWMGIYLEGLRR